MNASPWRNTISFKFLIIVTQDKVIYVILSAPPHVQNYGILGILRSSLNQFHTQDSHVQQCLNWTTACIVCFVLYVNAAAADCWLLMTSCT